MEEALLALLLADAGVAAIVADRIAWSWREQGTALPALTLVRTDGQRDVALRGYTGFVDGHVQADCWGAYQADATALARAVVAAVAGASEATTGGVVQGVFVEHEAAEFEGEKPDRIFRTRLSLRVPHAET